MDRIRQREQAMFLKKHAMIVQKDDKKMERAIKFETSKQKLANKYEGKVQSKLHVETKAMQEKRREKFNPDTDDRTDAMTMGGKLPI